MTQLTVPALLLACGLVSFAQDLPPQCENYKHVPIPKDDQPRPAEAKALTGCSSEDLYYGFGNAADYVKARHCAYLELDREDASNPFTGGAILAMIYANGKGVERNLDLARRFACGSGWAPAEFSYRVDHLEKLKAERSARLDFDFCDDVTSGYMEGFCAAIQEKRDKAKREAKLAAITAKWTAEDKKALTELRKLADAFFGQRSTAEVDLSGTGRAALEIEESAGLQDHFVDALDQFEKGKLPSFRSTDFALADADLNTIYLKIQRTPPQNLGTVTPQNIRATQRQWIQYRDAWVRFGKEKYPGVSAASWDTWLTRERIQQLKEFAGDR